MCASKPQLENQWLEVAIFIHGISPEMNPTSHRREYGDLLKAVNAGLKERGKPKLSKPIRIEWGRKYRGSKGMDQYLAQVERILNTGIKESMGIGDYSGLLGVYKPFRELLFFGIADLMYYVSSDGRRALRTHVFRAIANQVMNLAQESNRLSLTFFTHSAGSIIAHDLLYYLFGKKYLRGELAGSEVKGIMKYARRKSTQDTSATLLRVRRLYTFGSPISLLSIRAHSLINKLRNHQLLDTEDIGLRQADGLENPRWVNFWDKDDLIAAPVSFLYDNSLGVIKDIPVNSGIVLPSAHTSYWHSLELANHIADTF
jgi:hypothetical protein